MADSVFDFVSGDTLPIISGVLTEDDGITPINITGYVITLHIGYEVPLAKTAIIPLGTDGVFYFPWDADDLIAGTWLAEVQLVNHLSLVQTAQKNEEGSVFKIRVKGEVA